MKICQNKHFQSTKEWLHAISSPHFCKKGQFSFHSKSSLLLLLLCVKTIISFVALFLLSLVQRRSQKDISLSAFAFIYDNNMNCPTSTDELSFKNAERDMLQRNIINKHLWWRRWRRWRRCDEIGGREKKESWKWSKKKVTLGSFWQSCDDGFKFHEIAVPQGLKEVTLDTSRHDMYVKRSWVR